MNTPGALLLASAAAALLMACATAPSPGGEPWTTGRLSLRVAPSATQTSQNLSAAFELRGNAEGGELNLNSPLGLRLVAARWGAAGAVLATGEGEQRFADLDALSRQALGEPLPLAALPDWLAGRPWPLRPYTQTAGGFEQLGWQVDLQRFAEGWIVAQRDAPPAVSLRIKIDSSSSP